MQYSESQTKHNTVHQHKFHQFSADLDKSGLQEFDPSYTANTLMKYDWSSPDFVVEITYESKFDTPLKTAFPDYTVPEDHTGARRTSWHSVWQCFHKTRSRMRYTVSNHIKVQTSFFGPLNSSGISKFCRVNHCCKYPSYSALLAFWSTDCLCK